MTDKHKTGISHISNTEYTTNFTLLVACKSLPTFLQYDVSTTLVITTCMFACLEVMQEAALSWKYAKSQIRCLDTEIQTGLLIFMVAPCINNIKHFIVQLMLSIIYRVIHKCLREFRTRLRNNQDRHGRKEHINTQRISPSFFCTRGLGVLPGSTARGQS